MNKELVSLKKDEVLLKEEIVKLNDDEYIAKLARKDYFLSDKDEIIFTLPETKKQENSKMTLLKVILHSFFLFGIIYSKYDFVYF